METQRGFHPIHSGLVQTRPGRADLGGPGDGPSEGRLSASARRLRSPSAPLGLLAAALCATLVSPATARAEDERFAQPPVSILGATILAEGEQAFAVAAGLPDVELTWLHGLSSLADAALRVRFQYGRGVRLGGGGATVGATLRLHLGDAGAWSVALVSEPELMLHFLGEDHPPTTTAGGMALALTPLAGGITVSRELMPDLRLAVSVATAVTLFAVPEAVLSVPLQVGIGAEARLDRNLWLFTKLDSGFDFYGPGGIPGSSALLRARIGLAFGG